MTQRVKLCILLTLTVISVAPSLVSAQSDITLGKRYLDPINGFSLRPPANTQRRREYSPSRLVSWFHRDQSSGAIDLTLTILKREEARENIQIKPYAKALKTKLAEEDDFKITSMKVTSVSGRDAIDLSGHPQGGTGLWQRQVWVWTETGEFLILVAAGPSGNRREINNTYQAVLDTFKVFDPSEAREERKENLQRGEKLLEDLPEIAENQELIPRHKNWYLISMNDQDVGYMYVSGGPASREGSHGYEVRSFVKMNVPGDKPREVRRAHFATPDRQLARWRERLVVGTGENRVRTSEDGIKQGDLIFCEVKQGNQERTRKQRIKGTLLGIYLPRAFGMELGRLVDLGEKSSYSFATYNSTANEFDMRTFSVLGKQKIVIQSREVNAIAVTDQPAADADPAELWLSSDGELLRMKTVDELVMDLTTRSAVIRRFPDDEAQIRSLK